MTQPSETGPGRAGARRAYGGLLLFLVALVTTSLLLARAYRGWYARPPFFAAFRFFDFLQIGLLTAAGAAGMAAAVSAVRGHSLRVLALLPPTAAAAWFFVWSIVHGVFGIRLSIPQVWELVREPAVIQLVGLGRWKLALVSGGLLLFAGLLAAGLETAAARSGERFVRRSLAVLATAFLALNLSVRAYFAYHISHNQRAVLTLDEATPLALRTESLLPGLGSRRVRFPSLADPRRTEAYMGWVAGLPAISMPRKPGILWITVESLRYDALTDSTAPYLTAHAAEFGLRKGGDHWAGGNATKAGIFAMLTGLGASHMPEFRVRNLKVPFLTMLERNGYRLRIAKGLSLEYGGLGSYFPAGAISQTVDAPSMPAGDRAMVDSLLADFERRGPAPAFDFLTFDATHWPYDDPEVYRRVGPATRPERIYNLIGSPKAVGESRARYGRSVRFIDGEIARVIECLRRAGRLDSTIIVITGDHGEEFLERGQLGHSSGINDFQTRVPLWIRFPDEVRVPPDAAGLTSNLDIIPTLLDYLGFDHDVLWTQGRSLLAESRPREMLMVAEQGWSDPFFHALVSDTYVTRWRASGNQYLFSSVERRDGLPVEGDAWWGEIRAHRSEAADGYDRLPDVHEPKAPFVHPKSG